jgi:hypothetical protein
VLTRFARDDDETVRAVLRDLVESGVVFASGAQDRTLYRAAQAEELSKSAEAASPERLANLVWVMLQRFGPISLDALREHLPGDDGDLGRALLHLEGDGRAQRLDGEPHLWTTEACVIPPGAPHGWEAAVFDHYQAMVAAICAKLQVGKSSRKGDWVGGSTYGFVVWDDHPMRDEAVAFLEETRERAVSLRERIAGYNATREVPEDAVQVIAYVGQNVVGRDSAWDPR